MVLHPGGCGRVGHRQTHIRSRPPNPPRVGGSPTLTRQSKTLEPTKPRPPRPGLVPFNARLAVPEPSELLRKGLALLVTGLGSRRTHGGIHRVGAEHVLGAAVREDRFFPAAVGT